MPLWGKTDSSTSMPKAITGGVEDRVLFEDMASVYTDAFPGTTPSGGRLGWYFTNPAKGNKVNWYFFSNTEATIKLGQSSFYALITLDSTTSKPFIAVYTVKQGTGDASSWYRSRIVSITPTSATTGNKFLLHVGDIPQEMFPGIPRLAATSTISSVGPRGSDEVVLTVSIGSDSAASAGTVKFVVEAAGVVSPSYAKNNIFRIRSMYNPVTDAQVASVAETLPLKASSVYLVDADEAELAKEKGITSSGWWTYKTYTTSTGKVRHKAECLVPMKVSRETSGDRGADDIILPNGKVTITTQPSSATVANDASFTLNVVADAEGASMTYQWQESTNGTTFTNIAGATSASYTSTGTLAKNGNKYKVVVSSSGLVSATSNSVTLTVS